MLTRNILKSISTRWKNSVIPIQVCSYHLSYIENLRDGNKIKEAGEDRFSKEVKSIIPSKATIFPKANEEIVNDSHISALKNLVILYKNEISQEKNENKTSLIRGHYSKLTSSIINDINLEELTASEAVQILDIFNSTDLLSLINDNINSIFTHIYHHLDDLPFLEYNKLSKVCTKVKKFSSESKVAKEIEFQLRNRFFFQLTSNFDKNNIDHLQNAFSFLCHYFYKDAISIYFIHKILNYKGEIPLENLTVILYSLFGLTQYPPIWFNLLDKVYNDIIRNINKINDEQINYIIYVISLKLRNSRDEHPRVIKKVYNVDFLDKLMKKFINLDPGFESAVNLVSRVTDMGHLNSELLNYTCASYFEKRTLTQENIDYELNKLMALVKALAMVKHKTIFWKDINDFISNDNLVLEFKYETLCILTLNLLCMDYYPHHILKKLFDSEGDFSQSFLNWTFIRIYQKIKTEPNYNGPMPSKSQMDSITKWYNKFLYNKKKYKSLLLNHLEEGLGSSTYIQSNLASKLFHIIDHVIVVQKNKVLVPINISTTRNKVKYMEDIDIPPECTIIAILLTPQHWFIRNTKVLASPFQVFVDTLEALSCKVILIPEVLWSETPQKLRTSFLMKTIELKLIKM